MERSDFFKKIMATGLACGCALRMQAGNAFAGASPDAGKNPNPAETPCDEKMEFTHTWIKRFMDVMDQQLDPATALKIMQINGQVCARGAYGEMGTTVPKSLDEVDKVIADWQKFLGPDNICRKDKTVFFNYVGNPKGLKIADGYCLCPMIENGPATLSATYCQCSVGYVGFMFQKLITGSPVKVELLESLRAGGKSCRFKVEI
jgi:hypothetical protein